MNSFKVFSIGKIRNHEGTVGVALDKIFIAALAGLEEYSHVQIVWWADQCDNEAERSITTIEKPYTKGRICHVLTESKTLRYQTGAPIGQNPTRKAHHSIGRLNLTFSHLQYTPIFVDVIGCRAIAMRYAQLSALCPAGIRAFCRLAIRFANTRSVYRFTATKLTIAPLDSYNPIV